MATVPGAMPVTTPVLLIVAIAVFELAQLPPAVPVALARARVDASQAAVPPIITPAAGSALTVNANVVYAEPHDAVLAV
jgi:hypothetical protein